MEISKSSAIAASSRRSGRNNNNNNNNNKQTTTVVTASTSSSGFLVILAVAAVLLLLFLGLQQEQPSTTVASLRQQQQQQQQNQQQQLSIMTDTTETMDIRVGVTSQGVSYYHCQSSLLMMTTEETSRQHLQLILLHGSAFTKEDWKSSGILQNFCSSAHQPVTAIALDLPVTARGQELQDTLMDLYSRGELSESYVSGVVTPSASGFTMMDWILEDSRRGSTVLDNHSYQVMIRSWIPVATNGLLNLPKNDKDVLFQSILSTASSSTSRKSWPILAIYGNQDGPGRQTSLLLQQSAGATALELPGRHPCYLDSPKAFVQHVLEFLQAA